MADVALGVSFDAPAITGPCGFSYDLPPFAFSFGFKLPAIPLIPTLPAINLAFVFKCDPKKPVDITAGLKWGGGREARFLPDISMEDDF